MAEKNIIMKRKKTDGTYDVYYPKTRAEDGTTFDEHLFDYTLQVPYATATGSANSYSVLLNGVNGYYEGMAIAVKINVSNTGASTININSLGAKSIRRPNGNTVSAGNLKAESVYSMRYNGTNFILQGSDSAGNATPGDVLSGKTFSNDNEIGISGTMPNRTGHVTAQDLSRSGTTLRFRPQPGYYNGATGNSVQRSDANFVAENILKGKSIFGLTGSADPRYLGWTQATTSANWGARFYGQAITFNNSLWYMGGFDNNDNLPRNVWYSSNGSSWAQATSTAGWVGRYFFGLLVYDNKLWVFGGFGLSNALNDVWYSSNGSSWTQATSAAAWGKRFMFGCAVFAGKMWLTGGSIDNTAQRDVWYSSNGSTWTQGPQPAWSARRYHKMVVYDNKMWVIGAWGATQQDIWYSTDGSSWSQATSNAQWSKRSGFNAEVFDNKMWVFAGTGCRDVWYSTNGSTWTQVYETADWSAREDAGSTVFNDRLWIMGGWSGSSGLADVWYGAIKRDGIFY